MKCDYLNPVLGLLAVMFGVLAPATQALGETERPALAPRLPWTTSRVVGSPEPPPPYTVEPAFTHVAWKNPIFAIREPDSEWLIIVEWPQAIAPAPSANAGSNDQPGPHFAPARAVRVLDRPGADQTAPFLELPDRAIYSLEFHPRYGDNGQVFVCSKTQPALGAGINILSRFVVSQRGRDDHEPLCDPASEQRILEWPSDGHDGGAVVFGQDGMLYVSTGDGSGDSDDKLTAQDAGTLLGKVLRIDVDHPDVGKAYAVPPDNPFLGVEGARAETWSLGHRNPWRMTIDAKTGALWVGNNGQDLWEFAHLIQRGDNCGWSVYEGSHPFYLNRQRGPGRMAPPTIEHDHGAFRSLTGGVVYYGRRHPELNGAYVYGDYSTGAIWAARHDGTRVAWNRELARTTLDIVAFATSHREELLVLDHASGIYRLVESPPDDSHQRFPRQLSETGLFDSVANHRPAAGVVPYAVTAPGWTDGAVAERLVALPGDTRIERLSAVQWEFPEGTVLVQTLSLPRIAGDSGATRRIETRLLTKQMGVWCGYSYVWNDAQDDATLAPSHGAELPLPSNVVRLDDQPPAAPRTWRVPSRTDCMSCHSRAANFVLSLNELQASCSVTHDGAQMTQLRALAQLNLFHQGANQQPGERPRLVNPYDVSQDLEARARSYLHVNCSVCHVAAGGGNSRMLLNLQQPREEMQVIDVFPQHQTLGLLSAMLVAPGEPRRSILYQRMSRRGPGQMPPRGTHAVDSAGVRLLDDWIAQLPPQRTFVKDWKIDDVADDLPQLGQGRLFETGSRLFRELGCAQCHRLAGGGGGAGPDLSGVAQKRGPRELLESILEPSKDILPEFAATIVVTSDGRTHEGRIAQEDDQQLVLHGADALAGPEIVLKDEIEERHLSATSTMPDGLLDRLQKSEILDLLAYVIAGGDPRHPTYAK